MAGVPYPMEVVPSSVVIPPHESRYVSVIFQPNAIRTYAATLEAAVENGGNPLTKMFTCELRGEGTLPSLTLELPTAEKGPPVLKFPRLMKVIRCCGYHYFAADPCHSSF